HGGRDYMIDVSTGDAKPVTPEGTAGTVVSPDGKSVVVRGPDGKRGIWPLDGGGFHPIPGLEAGYSVIGWTPDGESVYVAPISRRAKSAKVSRVNLQTGKMEPWKTFGEETGSGVTAVVAPHLSSDGTAYAYLYVRVLSEAYVVNGLK
ncbi:MAG: hypothetical protein WA804_19715, partial [Terriglobales bacterium]